MSANHGFIAPFPAFGCPSEKLGDIFRLPALPSPKEDFPELMFQVTDKIPVHRKSGNIRAPMRRPLSFWILEVKKKGGVRLALVSPYSYKYSPHKFGTLF